MKIIYLSLHCHHRNYFCIKVGSDESHFNVSLTVREKVTRQCPQTTTSEEKREPKRIRTEVPLLTSLNALPLGQTGLHKPLIVGADDTIKGTSAFLRVPSLILVISHTVSVDVKHHDYF